MPYIIPAGTTTGTALNLTGDTSGELQIKTNNGSTTAMTITTGGNVGVGTASPTRNLDIVGSAAAYVQIRGGTGTNQGSAYYIRNAANTSTLSAFGDRASIFGGTPDALVSIFTGNTPLTFDVNSSERMRIDSSGNVGIGTSSPAQKLHVQGGAIEIDNGGGAGTIYFVDTNGYINYASSTMQFAVNGAERMRIDSSGNVLVGTTSQTNSAKFTIQYAGSANNGLAFKDTADQTGTQFIAFHNNAGTQLGSIEKYDANSSIRLSNIGAIRFPATQVASANANTLDDYEEGTWTPTLGGTATYIDRQGTYTKIGRVVFLQGLIVVNNLGTGNASVVLGLPFTNVDSSSGSSAYFDNLATAVTSLVPFTDSNNPDLIRFRALTAAATTMATPTIFQNGTRVDFFLAYTST
jgi:hypothetical protein